MHEGIIESGITEKMKSRRVMDGIVDSSLASEFNRVAIDGLVESGQLKHSPKLEIMKKIKPSATRGSIGYRHYPGSKFA